MALALTLPMVGTASAAPTTGSCVVDQADAKRTVHALMNRCSATQILDLFAQAPLGEAPRGTKTISLLPVFEIGGNQLPRSVAFPMTRAQGTLGDSLTFTTKAGQPWVYKNYFFGPDLGGPLVPSVSRIDRKPVHAADFTLDFYGVPLSLHEYRQLTPTVWIGRDIGGGDGPTDTPTGGAIALH